MSEPLEEWQQRLERHFESLARTRASTGFPIFALEHGLEQEDLDEISSLLRSRLASGARLAPHWLLWTVYATERGYSYAGDEYWQSFGEQTPSWEYEDRYRITPWFRKFQKAYNGVVPSGPWAEHFRIIAWPITHAILPIYLQKQFARMLHEQRFRLAGLETFSPGSIGQTLAANTQFASRRFEEFLQQEELVGRIVLAMLHEDPEEAVEPIYPATLMRIVSDLERVRNAREWLKETQRVVSDRFKGIGRGSGPPAQPPHAGPDRRPDRAASHPEIRPTLLLRHSGADTWALLMGVPGFSGVGVLSKEVRNFLRRSRCRLNGADDTKPPGWILSGNRKGVLKAWPDPAKPLIAFEGSQGTVDHLLQTECRMTPGPVWLFRVGQDGIAREITGRIARPGYEYIVATIEVLPDAREGMGPCTIACSGVSSFRLSVPTSVSAEYTKWLQSIGIEIARTIRVWPAGLPGRGWDGEGSSEWLTTEAPRFGIVHDHPVDAYELRLNNRTRTVVSAGGVGFPAFVEIPPLPAGTHILTAKALRSSSLADTVASPPPEGFVELKVREPEPWVPGTAMHAGLVATVDPHDATLDMFWENDLSLSVVGPLSHSVTCAVSLEDSKGEEIFAEPVDGPMHLPVTPTGWRKRFSQFVTREDCAWRYMEAAAGTLVIKGEELGEYEIRFERDVLPVRWTLRRDHESIVLRLIDDSGLEEIKPTCFFLAMERPALAVSHKPADLLSGVVVQPPGGLFLAQHGEHKDAIVVSAGLTGDGLVGLGVSPGFDELQDGSEALAKAISALALWHHARLAGPLSETRRQQVTDGFLAAVYQKLCGTRWKTAEAAFLESPHSTRAIDSLRRAVDRRAGFAAVLRRDGTSQGNDLSRLSPWYADLARRYHVCNDPAICDFALRLASRPHLLPAAFGDELANQLDQMSDYPALLRGARLLALLCANQDRDEVPARMPRWR